MRAIEHNNKNFNIKEPFESLFTQGMVCHETYKDKNNNWLGPEQVEKKDGKYVIKGGNEIVKIGPQSQCLNLKKWLIQNL